MVSKNSIMKNTFSGILLIAAIPFIGAACSSQAHLKVEKQITGGELLFKNVNTSLSNQQKDSIFNSLGFIMVKDDSAIAMKNYFALDTFSLDFPFSTEVYPIDLNKDGKEEIIIFYGNTATSGMTGSSSVLFLPSSDGYYKKYWDFPCYDVDILNDKKTDNYPDLVIGGRGFSYPVWKWTGKEYDVKGKISDTKLKSENKTSLRGFEDQSN